jgi:hypothetical protein
VFKADDISVIKFVIEVATGEREDREPTPEQQGKDRYWPVSGPSGWF